MSLVGVYAAGLCMFLAGRPSIITCTRFLGERTFTATTVLVVCSACQGLCVGFVNRRLLGELVNRLESYRWVQLASQSFLVYPSGPVVPGRSSDPLGHLFPLFSSPLVDPFGLRPVSPPHSPSSIFFPRLSFSFGPSHQLLSLHTFTHPSLLMVTSQFFLCRSIH